MLRCLYVAQAPLCPQRRELLHRAVGQWVRRKGWGPLRKVGGAGAHRPKREPSVLAPRISPSGPGVQPAAGPPPLIGSARTCWLVLAAILVCWNLAEPEQDRYRVLSRSLQMRALYPCIDWYVHTVSVWAKPAVMQASPGASAYTGPETQAAPLPGSWGDSRDPEAHHLSICTHMLRIHE